MSCKACNLVLLNPNVYPPPPSFLLFLPPPPHSGAMPDPTCPGIRTLFPYPKSCHMRKIRTPLPPSPRQEFMLGIVNIQCPYFVGGESMLRRDLNLRRQRRMAQSERRYSGFILEKLKKLLKVPLFFTGESYRSSGKIS